MKFELEELFREKKVQETLFLLLAQRYELARVSEARDTSAFQILDRPVRAERRSWPKRTLILASAVLLGALLGWGYSSLRRSQIHKSGVSASPPSPA